MEVDTNNLAPDVTMIADEIGCYSDNECRSDLIKYCFMIIDEFEEGISYYELCQAAACYFEALRRTGNMQKLTCGRDEIAAAN